MSDTGENINIVTGFASDEARSIAAAHKMGERAAYVPTDDTDDDVRSAIAEVGDTRSDREAFDRSRENREELAWRYPDTKVGDLIKRFSGLHDDFKRDPMQAADHLARHYLAQPARFSKPKAREAEQPPAYLDEYGRQEWLRDQDAREAFRNAGHDRAENDAFKATAEDRAFLKKAFPQLTFDQAIERITSLDADLTADPLGASAKLAATFGAPITQMHHDEIRHVGEAQQSVLRMQEGLDRVVSSGKLPGIENMMDAVADVLEGPSFQRSGDAGVDLEAAYRVALQRVTIERDKAVAEKAKAASRSVPNAGGDYRPSDSAQGDDDIDADARAAYRRHVA